MTPTLTNLPRLTNTEFDQLVKLVFNQCGINLTPAKKIMLESRLSKRLRALDMSGFKEYIDHVTSATGMELELIHMIDVVTTNKTDFFREPHHFQFIRSVILPEFQSQHFRRDFRVWSAACSTGEEPYTLAMVLHDFAEQQPLSSFKIVASDIPPGPKTARFDSLNGLRSAQTVSSDALRAGMECANCRQIRIDPRGEGRTN